MIIITNINGESITLGNKEPYYLQIFDGVGNVPVVIESQKSVGQDGSTYIDNTLDGRALTIEGMIITKSSKGDVLEFRRRMQKVLNPKLGEVTIIYQDKKITGIVESTPTFPSGSKNEGPYYQKYLINILCSNPFWQDLETIKAEIAAWIGTFEFPLEIPIETGIEMGYRAPSLIVNVFNKGDVPCGIKIEFKALATVVNPSLLNVNTREYIKINKVMESGEVITVTTYFQNKRVMLNKNGIIENAFNWIDLGSTFLQLNVGDNLLRYDAEEGLDNLEVKIYYTPQYVGL